MRLLRCMSALVAAGVFGVVGVYVAAQLAVNAAGPALADVTATATAVIVPGASVKKNGEPSDILRDRLDVAVDLYLHDRVEQVFVSGSVVGDYNEASVMAQYVIAAGVDVDDVITDPYGFDTYDTLYNAANAGISDAFVATQEYHLPRAIYIGRALGMQVHGVSADLHTYVKEDAFLLRERFANVKAFLQILLQRE